MEAFADAIGLRMAHLRPRVLNVIQSQIKLVIMRLRTTAEFGTAIGQDTDHPHTLFSKEWQYPVVQQVCCRDRRLGCVELGGSPLRTSIDKGLLVNASNALDGADDLPGFFGPP